MARIFLSHSSANDVEAVALSDWLTAEGWDDLFLDLDPQRGIAAGERWERRLHEAANRCEAVLFVVSRAWLASPWCLKEFALAQKLNKRTFCILVEDIPIRDLPAELTATWQLVNLAKGSDHRMFRVTLPDGREEHVTFSQAGLARLRAGLTRAGLDARFFAWPPEDEPDRPPYRGLRPLEGEDAGIFYGREAPTIEALDRLRGLAEAAPPRLLAILGASGAGKSSFLRAGLVPRLKRDDRKFLVLPIVRPGRRALTGDTGLVHCLEEASRAVGLRHSRADLRAAVDNAAAVAAIIQDLTNAASQPDGDDGSPRAPLAVLAIDQAEELFLAEGAEEAGAFLALVGELAAAHVSNLIVVFTIRSDSFERLQTVPETAGLQPFSLPPMARGAYQTVIEGPAKRLAETDRVLTIEPVLTAALLADIEDGGGKDALPLLAFTLERLYLEYGGSGSLTLAQYRALGGIKGSIEAAVEGALAGADSDPAVPKERGARLALLRRALIPWLAGIDTESGQPRRRVARLSEIPAEARPLVEHLIAARLLATDVAPETGERTIEPAHEALLRQWGLLQGWLDEDFVALATLEGIKRAARDWAANDRDAAWLSHSAGRLEDAEAVARREDFAGLIEPTDRAYLDAARAADTARHNRELEEARKLAEAERLAAERQKQVAGRTRIGLIAASVFAVLAAGAAVFGFQKAREAAEQAQIASLKGTEAEQGAARLSVTVADQRIQQGATREAAVLLLQAAKSFDDKTVPDEMLIAFHRLNEAMAARQMYDLPAGSVAVEGFDALYFIDKSAGDVLRFDGSGPPTMAFDGDPKDSPIRQVGLAMDGKMLVIVRENRDVQKVVDGTMTLVGQLKAPEPKPGQKQTLDKLEIDSSGLIFADQYFMGTGGNYELAQLFDAATGKAYAGDKLAGRMKLLTSADGRRYIDILVELGRPNTTYRIDEDATSLTLTPQELSQSERNALLFRQCFVNAHSAVADFTPKVEFNPANHGDLCIAKGKEIIHTQFGFTSAGEDRSDEVINPDVDEPTTIQDLISKYTKYDIPRQNLSWVSGDAELDEYAIIVNRDLLVFDEYGTVLLQKHATKPTTARFLANGRLAVVEAAANRITVYDLAYQPPRKEITHDGADALIAQQAKLATLNKGTCVGFAIGSMGDGIDYTATLPDGAKLMLAGSTLSSGEGPAQVTIATGGKDQKIDLADAGEGESCVQFSTDWKRLLLWQRDGPVTLYDFDKVRANGSLDGAKLGELPGKYISAAFPVGATGDVVTAAYGEPVLRWHMDTPTGAWSSEEVYSGDEPVFYAEPDITGDRLLLLESTGAGEVKGVLYSVPARQRWIELGNDYKWFGEAFSEDGGIAAGARQIQHFLRLPTLDQLVTETEGRLPPRCRPTTPGAYDTSPCWPDWLRAQ